MPTASKCSATGTAAMAAVSPAPASPPALKPACIEETTGRPAACSTCTPTALTATLSIPVAAPNASSTAASAITDPVSPGSTTVIPVAAAASAVVAPGPRRAHNAPVTCMPASAPIEMHSSTRPSVAGDAPTWDVTSGMRAAQVPNTAPSVMNTAVAAMRRARIEGAGTRRRSKRPVAPGSRGNGMRFIHREESGGAPRCAQSRMRRVTESIQ
jgi:hypothetical protein